MGSLCPANLTPAEVVHRQGAMQSQEFGPAKWSVGQRISGATEPAISRAIDAGEILRTHVLRPTWHFVAPADIRWLLELTGPRVHQGNAGRYRELGLDAETLAKSDATIAAAVEGGRYPDAHRPGRLPELRGHRYRWSTAGPHGDAR